MYDPLNSTHKQKNAWPFRDYLIRAINEDKPHSQFIAEQVAGDALFPDDPQAIDATGMLATVPWDESSRLESLKDSTDSSLLTANALPRAAAWEAQFLCTPPVWHLRKPVKVKHVENVPHVMRTRWTALFASQFTRRISQT